MEFPEVMEDGEALKDEITGAGKTFGAGVIIGGISVAAGNIN